MTQNEEIKLEFPLCAINGETFVVDIYEDIIYSLNDPYRKFELNKSPFCVRCKTVMNFYHAIDTIYDRYDCNCGEDRWVLREFTPREKPIKEVPLEEAPENEEMTPRKIAALMEEITDRVINETLIPTELEYFINLLSSSERLFNYFVTCYTFYNMHTDVRAVMQLIHHNALNDKAYKTANEHHMKHIGTIRQLYPVSEFKHNRANNPFDKEAIKNFMDNIFQYI